MLLDLRCSAVEGSKIGAARRGSVCDMPFEDGRFDAVLATDVIERVEDGRLALAELSCAYHFDYLPLLLIWSAWRVMRLARIRLESEGQVRGPMLDRIPSAIFTLDIPTASRLHVPFGVSILVPAIKSAR